MREQPLGHLINTPGAVEDFLKRHTQYTNNAIQSFADARDLTRNVSGNPVFPPDMARFISDFLPPSEIEMCARLNPNSKATERLLREGARQAAATTANGFAAMERARRQQHGEETKRIDR